MKRRRYRRPRSRVGGTWAPDRQRASYIVDQKISDAIASTSFNVTTTGDFELLNGLASGSDYNQRVGRRIEMDYLELKGDFFYASTTLAHPADMIRFLIVYDKQPNGAAPAVTDVLNGANADAFDNINNLGRFEILKDIVWTLPQVPASTTSPVYFPRIKWKVPIKRSTQYSGTGATIASIASGSLYLLMMGSQASGSNNTVFEGSARLFFHG